MKKDEKAEFTGRMKFESEKDKEKSKSKAANGEAATSTQYYPPTCHILTLWFSKTKDPKRVLQEFINEAEEVKPVSCSRIIGV